MTAETCPCTYCRKPTPSLGTKLCDSCWELNSRIERNPEIAVAVLKNVPGYDKSEVTPENVRKLLDAVGLRVWQPAKGDFFKLVKTRNCYTNNGLTPEAALAGYIANLLGIAKR